MTENDETGTWGPVGDDVVGTASARLLAAGVPRRDRLQALRLLGVLEASSDADGLVRRPLTDLAGEFDLDPGDAERWLDALRYVGIARSTARGVVLAGREAPAANGLRLTDFLANAAAVIDDDVPATAPIAVMADHRRASPRPLAVAGAAAAAVALVLGLLGSSALDDDRASVPAATGRADLPVSVPAPSSDSISPSATASGAVAAPAGTPGVAPSPAGGPGTSSPPAPSGFVAADPSCPAAPSARVVAVTADAGDDARTGLTTWTVTVAGSLVNDSDATARIDALFVTVEVAGELIEAAAAGLPELVEPGETHRWVVAVPVGPTAPDLGPAAADLGWRWADADLQASCGI